MVELQLEVPPSVQHHTVAVLLPLEVQQLVWGAEGGGGGVSYIVTQATSPFLWSLSGHNAQFSRTSFDARDSGGVKESLVLGRAERDEPHQDERLELLVLDGFLEVHEGV